MVRCTFAGRLVASYKVRNAMDRARMNSAIRVFNEAIEVESAGGMVSEKVKPIDINSARGCSFIVLVELAAALMSL